MVATKKIQLTQKEYFKILLVLYLKRRWWLIGFIIIMALVNLGSDYAPDNLFIVFAVIYPPLVFFQLWRYVTSPENKGFYAEAHHEIDESEFRSYLTDGSESTVKLSLFVKVKEINSNYLLYLSAHQFITIPYSAFRTENDRIWFYRQITSAIKTIRNSLKYCLI